MTRSSYVIQWKSKVNGRAGKGTKLFEKQEAERLAEELNGQYPQIEHQAVPFEPPRHQEEPSEPSDLVPAHN
ncbi:MAG TPA: hypothetical protein VLT36_10455 [Candidatus Dormibacteraeota bacterium]|nr:hypothetical protein [Candidatus Dormibacteraeota bacterium]